MAISLTLTPFSNAITASVTDLEAESRLVWYLDGKEFAIETVEESTGAHSFTLVPVYFASPHTVRLDVYKEDEAVFSETAQTSTLYADLPLWSWSASNGDATAAQTVAAHEAATTQGLVANYNYLVWDDFVQLLKDALDAVGLPWLSTYTNYENAFVGKTYGELTAQRFNAVVQNIRYPYWTWESKPGSYGYLGRQTMRKNDTVFGQYMIEIAKYLNVVLGIYNGTANTKEAQALMEAAAVHSAIARARPSAPIRHTSSLGSMAENAGLIRLPLAPFGASDNTSLVHKSEAVYLPLVPAKTNERIRLRQTAALMAQIWREFIASETLALSGANSLRVGSVYPAMVNTELGLSSDMVLGYSPTELMQAAGMASAAGLGALSRHVGANINGTAIVEQLAAATLYALRQLGIVAAASDTVQTEGSLDSGIAATVAGYFSATSSAGGSVNAVRPIVTIGTAITETETAGELENSRPNYADGAAEVITLGLGAVEQQTPERMRGSSRTKISVSSEISKYRTVYLIGAADVGVACYGNIGNEQPDSGWIYPSRDGNVLYIAQAYHTDRIENGIRIAWKPTVKTDAGIYIPQVFHADQKDNVLSIVYYSPVRTENTLYIRQMNETLKGV